MAGKGQAGYKEKLWEQSRKCGRLALPLAGGVVSLTLPQVTLSSQDGKTRPAPLQEKPHVISSTQGHISVWGQGGAIQKGKTSEHCFLQ